MHSVVDMGYYVYQYVDRRENWNTCQHLYSHYNGYVFANEGKHSIRKEYDCTYKDNRKEYKYQELHIRARAFWQELLANDNFKALSLEGYEGDDICALLALKYEYIIVGCDKDFLQLPCVRIEKIDGTRLHICQEALPKGLQSIPFTYRHWLLWLVLDGDKSDNVKQLRGKGKVGLSEVSNIMQDVGTMWYRACDVFGFEEVIHNLKLVLLPHPSLLDMYLTDEVLLELVATDKYYSFVKDYSKDIPL